MRFSQRTVKEFRDYFLLPITEEEDIISNRIGGSVDPNRPKKPKGPLRPEINLDPITALKQHREKNPEPIVRANDDEPWEGPKFSADPNTDLKFQAHKADRDEGIKALTTTRQDRSLANSNERFPMLKHHLDNLDRPDLDEDGIRNYSRGAEKLFKSLGDDYTEGQARDLINSPWMKGVLTQHPDQIPDDVDWRDDDLANTLNYMADGIDFSKEGGDDSRMKQLWDHWVPNMKEKGAIGQILKHKDFDLDKLESFKDMNSLFGITDFLDGVTAEDDTDEYGGSIADIVGGMIGDIKPEVSEAFRKNSTLSDGDMPILGGMMKYAQARRESENDDPLENLEEILGKDNNKTSPVWLGPSEFYNRDEDDVDNDRWHDAGPAGMREGRLYDWFINKISEKEGLDPKRKGELLDDIFSNDIDQWIYDSVLPEDMGNPEEWDAVEDRRKEWTRDMISDGGMSELSSDPYLDDDANFADRMQIIKDELGGFGSSRDNYYSDPYYDHEVDDLVGRDDIDNMLYGRNIPSWYDYDNELDNLNTERMGEEERYAEELARNSEEESQEYQGDHTSYEITSTNMANAALSAYESEHPEKAMEDLKRAGLNRSDITGRLHEIQWDDDQDQDDIIYRGTQKYGEDFDQYHEEYDNFANMVTALDAMRTWKEQVLPDFKPGDSLVNHPVGGELGQRAYLYYKNGFGRVGPEGQAAIVGHDGKVYPVDPPDKELLEQMRQARRDRIVERRTRVERQRAEVEERRAAEQERLDNLHGRQLEIDLDPNTNLRN